MITIGIVENNLLLSERYREGFEAADDFALLFCYWGLEALEEECSTGTLASPEVILLEVGRANLVRTLKGVKHLFPQAKLLIISVESCDAAIRDAVGQGVHGFLTPDLSFEELAVQVRRFQKGHPVFAVPVLRRILELFNQPAPAASHYAPDPELTDRENDIARCLCRGLTYKQIGQELNLSVYTVNQHLKKVYLKKGVNSRHELASRMMRERGTRDR